MQMLHKTHNLFQKKGKQKYIKYTLETLNTTTNLRIWTQKWTAMRLDKIAATVVYLCLADRLTCPNKKNCVLGCQTIEPGNISASIWSWSVDIPKFTPKKVLGSQPIQAGNMSASKWKYLTIRSCCQVSTRGMPGLTWISRCWSPGCLSIQRRLISSPLSACLSPSLSLSLSLPCTQFLFHQPTKKKLETGEMLIMLITFNSIC